jgi:transcription elongation factor Elf1
MDKDLSELVQYLDKKFQETASKDDVAKLSLRITNIASMVNGLQENKADKSDINNLLNAVDAYAKKADTYFQEMVMLSHKVDRHEKWFHLIADKLGIKLEY